MTNIDLEKLHEAIANYSEQMKIILPLEKQVNKLRRSDKTIDEIKTILGDKCNIFDYVPKTLYHGSPESLDVINPNESTQSGSYVYATDNPVHALFFSIFRNSSIARAHINERIDENGDYKVKYEIDERVKGALDKIISDKEITIHVCDGNQFFKPQGDVYIGREWISKQGQSIVPTNKIHVNVKEFFKDLEKQGLVEYNRYDKSKNWKTVIDMLSQNYPFGLNTSRGKNIDEFDSLYDEFIETNFPEKLEFSKYLRTYIKDVMSHDYKSENPNMSEVEENNYKLKVIRDFTKNFLISSKDEKGKINYSVDINRVNEFMKQSSLQKDEQIQPKHY